MIISKNERACETRSAMRQGQGQVVLEHILQDKFSVPEKCRLFSVVTLQKGCSIGWHEHVEETEFYHILSGKGFIDDDGTEKQIVEGDTVVTGNGAGHSIRNEDDEPLAFLAVIVKD